MARHAKSDPGERYTASLRLQLTPSQRTELETGAAEAGTNLSQYVRELCLRRAGAAPVVAGTKRNPDARALMHELTAIGNNLNQIARIANSTKAMPQLNELHRTMGVLKAALARVIEL
jgi:Bacterial mobilisation protein (MobC)